MPRPDASQRATSVAYSRSSSPDSPGRTLLRRTVLSSVDGARERRQLFWQDQIVRRTAEGGCPGSTAGKMRKMPAATEFFDGLPGIPAGIFGFDWRAFSVCHLAVFIRQKNYEQPACFPRPARVG